MDKTSGLASFPVELLTAIATSLNKPDLFSLRLVCRNASAGIDDHFLDTFFKRRTHLYSCHSLEVLAAISKQPRIARKMEEVALAVEAPHNMNVGLLENGSASNCGDAYACVFAARKPVGRTWKTILGLDRLAPTLATGSCSPEKDRHENSGSVKGTTQRICSINQMALEDRERLRKDKYAVELLLVTFSALSMDGKPRRLASPNVPDCFDDKTIYGKATMERALPKRSCLSCYPFLSESDCSEAVKSMLMAAAAAKLAVSQLDLCYRGYHHGLTRRALVLEGCRKDGLSAIWTNLSALAFKIKNDDLLFWQSQDGSAPLKVFSQAINLQELAVKCDDDIRTSLHCDPEDFKGFKALRTLSFKYVYFEQQQLQGLVEKLASSLEYLILYNVGIKGAESWCDVFDTMARLPNLNDVYLCDLYRRSESDPYAHREYVCERDPYEQYLSDKGLPDTFRSRCSFYEQWQHCGDCFEFESAVEVRERLTSLANTIVCFKDESEEYDDYY